ncbi:hypothetical protein SAMN04488511_11527 [Pedobacter suwonensis]|uniref:Uncharacterized protein n=1 Tax=Pedobacter suwonensis TaxID=332999 RepID=A0A1I0TV55_9SPHI|nr:hypothetical protein SAMN04488511_11527 [Pedobacter suwonensis]
MRAIQNLETEAISTVWNRFDDLIEIFVRMFLKHMDHSLHPTQVKSIRQLFKTYHIQIKTPKAKLKPLGFTIFGTACFHFVIENRHILLHSNIAIMVYSYR